MTFHTRHDDASSVPLEVANLARKLGRQSVKELVLEQALHGRDYNAAPPKRSGPTARSTTEVQVWISKIRHGRGPSARRSESQNSGIGFGGLTDWSESLSHARRSRTTTRRHPQGRLPMQLKVGDPITDEHAGTLVVPP
jgi:hypothetical protein